MYTHNCCVDNKVEGLACSSKVQRAHTHKEQTMPFYKPMELILVNYKHRYSRSFTEITEIINIDTQEVTEITVYVYLHILLVCLPKS